MTEIKADEIVGKRDHRAPERQERRPTSADDREIVAESSHIPDRDQEFIQVTPEGAIGEEFEKAEISDEIVIKPLPTPIAKGDEDDNLHDLTEEELRTRAEILGVPGREKMSHRELVMAIIDTMRAS